MLGLAGAIDMHIHSGPDLFERVGDSLEIAKRCEAAGMRAVVFKAHHEGTMTRAYFCNKQLENLKVFGGFTLNDFTGGINPTAAKLALDLGAKIIWAPTMHSKYHEEIFGRGTYGIKRLSVEGTIHKPGIGVLDDKGGLISELVDILELVKAKGAIFGTSHLGPREIEAIVDRYASQMKILINHPLFLPRMPNEWFAQMAAKGAHLEICATSCQPMAVNQGGEMTLKRAVDLIHLSGVERCVISSDAGQTHNPWPDDALRAFINCLYDVGMPEEGIGDMVVTNPAKLMGL
jgi:hypothetical protein